MVYTTEYMVLAAGPVHVAKLGGLVMKECKFWIGSRNMLYQNVSDS